MAMTDSIPCFYACQSIYWIVSGSLDSSLLVSKIESDEGAQQSTSKGRQTWLQCANLYAIQNFYIEIGLQNLSDPIETKFDAYQQKSLPPKATQPKQPVLSDGVTAAYKVATGKSKMRV